MVMTIESIDEEIPIATTNADGLDEIGNKSRNRSDRNHSIEIKDAMIVLMEKGEEDQVIVSTPSLQSRKWGSAGRDNC